MTREFIKGGAGLPETEEFAKKWPLSDDPQVPTLVTVQAFDAWAGARQYYSLNQDPDTVSGCRNRLRYKINNTACSEAWTLQDRPPFHIQVRLHGREYEVISTERAFNHKAERLPRQIKSLTMTKQEALKAMRESIDYEHLPIKLQIRIDNLEKGIGRLVRDITHNVTEYTNEFISVQSSIAKMVEEGRLTSENGGIQAMLGVLKDDSEPDDDGGEDA